MNVAEQLGQQGFSPIFIFGPKESALLDGAASELHTRGWPTWVSTDFRIQPLAGLLSHCAFTLTNDCAVMHVSASIGTPTAAIFGPTHSKVWFPYSRDQHLVIENELDCRKTCQWGCDDRRCLEAISENDVLLRLQEWQSVSNYS
jgi:heptosyltransferase-2/heptosyltransferase-3